LQGTKFSQGCSNHFLPKGFNPADLSALLFWRMAYIPARDASTTKTTTATTAPTITPVCDDFDPFGSPS